MPSLDRTRRLNIVKSLKVIVVGLVMAYLIPEIIGFIMKLQTGNETMKPFEIAMNSMPIRIFHIIGLVVAGVAMIYLFKIWSARFTEPREGET